MVGDSKRIDRFIRRNKDSRNVQVARDVPSAMNLPTTAREEVGVCHAEHRASGKFRPALDKRKSPEGGRTVPASPIRDAQPSSRLNHLPIHDHPRRIPPETGFRPMTNYRCILDVQ